MLQYHHLQIMSVSALKFLAKVLGPTVHLSFVQCLQYLLREYRSNSVCFFHISPIWSVHTIDDCLQITFPSVTFRQYFKELKKNFHVGKLRCCRDCWYRYHLPRLHKPLIQVVAYSVPVILNVGKINKFKLRGQGMFIFMT